MSSIKSANLCSCIICRKELTHKGIHSHFIISHTIDGNERAKRNGKIQPTLHPQKIISKNNEKLYLENPKLCRNCNTTIPYSLKRNIFCNSFCAAKYNNSGKKHSVESKLKRSITILNGFKTNRIQPSKPKFTQISWCKICNKLIQGRRKICSPECFSTLMQDVCKNRKTIRNKNNFRYKGVTLGSSYELKLAISLDENLIKWVQPRPITYHDLSNKAHKYYPDFYLPDYNVYLDPKNDFLINNINPYFGYSDKDKIKWVQEQNDVKILILDKNNLSWESIKGILWEMRDSNPHVISNTGV